jgi:hypothetical protein
MDSIHDLSRLSTREERGCVDWGIDFWFDDAI